MASEELGRVSADELNDGSIEDTPSKKVAAILSKQDEILDKLNLLLGAIDGAADGNALNTALQGVDLSVLNKVKLFR